MDSPINDLIYQRPKLQLQLNNKDELKDQKYHTKHTFLLTSIIVKQLLLLLLRRYKAWQQEKMDITIYARIMFVL